MVQSVLLLLDDASLWLCSHVQPASRWILAGASAHCTELAIDKRKQIQAATAAGLSSDARCGVENANGRLRRWLPRHIDHRSPVR